MEQLKKIRTPLRSAFTRAAVSLEELISTTESDIEVENLAVLIAQLTEKFEKLNITDQKILDILQTDATLKISNEDFNAEIESTETYRDRFISLKTKSERILKRIDSKEQNKQNIEITECTAEKRKYKLPRIELKKFNGEVTEFLGFWGQFRKIHDDTTIDPEDKYQYLLQSTEVGSRARDLVESFPPTAANYPKAIEYLKSRFGKEEILVEVYVRELLSLVLSNTMNTNSRSSLFKLYDKIEAHLRALETLGVTTDKYAAMLYPLVEACLPEDVIRAWERSRGSMNKYSSVNNVNREVENADDKGKLLNKLQLLMSFLRSEVEGEERISLVKSGFGISNDNKHKVLNKTPRITRRDIPTATGLLIESQAHKSEFRSKNCIFCSHSHEPQDCKLAQKWTLEERRKLLSQKGACFICLKTGHVSRKCFSKINCQKCHRRHLLIMCSADSRTPENVNKMPIESKSSSGEKIHNLANPTCTPDILLQALVVRLHGKEGDQLVIRAIIDTGSQRSYITSNVVELMKCESLGQEKMTHSLFGGKESCETHHKYKVHLSNIENNYHCSFDVFDQEMICSNIPRTKHGPWTKELKELGIEIHDQTYNENGIDAEIKVLIGADVAGKLFTGRIQELKCGLVAMETRLGWTLMGKVNGISHKDSSMLVLSLHVAEKKISDLWNLDSLGILDPAEKKNQSELQEEAKIHFLKTLTRLADGRYEVSLPWIEGHPELPSNRVMAEKRLKSTVKSLVSKDKLESYEATFKEWLNEKIIEEVNISEDDEACCHYLPHRAVFKENSTTKIRPVFDGSAKVENFPSLNDCLEKGPNLVELIPSVLTRFRLGKYGVISDIRKAFLMISLAKHDRDYLRFLWWEEGNPERLKVYKHCRVVFGISSSPFLLGATLAYHLDNIPPRFRETSDKLKNSLYVDNCVASFDSETELHKFMTEAKEIMGLAKFDLRGWQWNSTSNSTKDTNETELNAPLLKESSESQKMNNDVPVLGLQWNIESDTLSIDLRGLVDADDGAVTKRKILSTTHRIFDPIGITCPVTLIPKIMLQKCWQLKTSWDQDLPDEVVKEYRKWKRDLSVLKDINIPRHVCKFLKSGSTFSLHIFSDASQTAYATCIFLHTENQDGEVYCQLVQARSRVSPLKKITIPRLELLACCIGARLYNSLKTDFKNIPAFFWTDSADVLYWIKKPEVWGTFVMNRVKEIRSLTDADSWNYVPGNLNPSDLPSRGCYAKCLVESHWWEGPDWLKQKQEFWPKCNIFADPDIVNSEKRKTVVSASNTVQEDFNLFERISSYNKIIRITAWIFRFYHNVRHKNEKRSGDLQVEEFSQAERTIFKVVQKWCFNQDVVKKLSLQTFTDSEGILRVKTKISMRNDLEAFRYPVLLPSKHPIVSKLIMQQHLDLNHAGVHVLMSCLRENYWILKNRKTIRHAIYGCIKCKRFSSCPVETVSCPLPEDRVRDAAIFEIIGVDLAGPLYLKKRTKGWIVIFTCAVFRAVHLELTTSLSTNSFLQALKRFISRRDAAIFEIIGVDLAGPLYLKKRTKGWIVIFTCAVFRAVHLELTTSLSTNSFLQALKRFIS